MCTDHKQILSMCVFSKQNVCKIYLANIMSARSIDCQNIDAVNRLWFDLKVAQCICYNIDLKKACCAFAGQ